MSDNTKHLAKKCVKDAWPCLALRLAGTMMTGGVLDLVFGCLTRLDGRTKGKP